MSPPQSGDVTVWNTLDQLTAERGRPYGVACPPMEARVQTWPPPPPPPPQSFFNCQKFLHKHEWWKWEICQLTQFHLRPVSLATGVVTSQTEKSPTLKQLQVEVEPSSVNRENTNTQHGIYVLSQKKDTSKSLVQRLISLILLGF